MPGIYSCSTIKQTLIYIANLLEPTEISIHENQNTTALLKQRTSPPDKTDVLPNVLVRGAFFSQTTLKVTLFERKQRDKCQSFDLKISHKDIRNCI